MEQWAVDKLERSLKYEDGRYVTGSIWKPGEPNFPPTNAPYAQARFQKLLRSFPNEEIKKAFFAIPLAWVSRGWGRIVPPDEPPPPMAIIAPGADALDESSRA